MTATRRTRTARRDPIAARVVAVVFATAGDRKAYVRRARRLRLSVSEAGRRDLMEAVEREEARTAARQQGADGGRNAR